MLIERCCDAAVERHSTIRINRWLLWFWLLSNRLRTLEVITCCILSCCALEVTHISRVLLTKLLVHTGITFITTLRRHQTNNRRQAIDIHQFIRPLHRNNHQIRNTEHYLVVFHHVIGNAEQFQERVHHRIHEGSYIGITTSAVVLRIIDARNHALEQFLEQVTILLGQLYTHHHIIRTSFDQFFIQGELHNGGTVISLFFHHTTASQVN